MENTVKNKLIRPDNWSEHGIIGVWTLFGFGWEQVEERAYMELSEVNRENRAYTIQSDLFAAAYYRNRFKLDDVISNIGKGKDLCKVAKSIILFESEVDKCHWELSDNLVEVVESKN